MKLEDNTVIALMKPGRSSKCKQCKDAIGQDESRYWFEPQGNRAIAKVVCYKCAVESGFDQEEDDRQKANSKGPGRPSSGSSQAATLQRIEQKIDKILELYSGGNAIAMPMQAEQELEALFS